MGGFSAGDRQPLPGPLGHAFQKFIPRNANGSAAFAGIPAPLHQRRFHMLHNLVNVAAAILGRIFRSSHSCRSVSPSQIIGISGDGKCQPAAPGGMCRPTRFLLPMAAAAFCAGNPVPIGAPSNLHRVIVAVIFLAVANHLWSGNSCSGGGAVPARSIQKRAPNCIVPQNNAGSVQVVCVVLVLCSRSHRKPHRQRHPQQA